MSLSTFSGKYLFENDSIGTVDINDWLNLAIDHRMAFVNMLFFMDNRTQEVLYKQGLRIKVIRTKKLDLGFLMLTDYKSAAEQNEMIIDFLNQNPSYWSIHDEKMKLNSNLVLDHRTGDIDKLAKYFEFKKTDVFF